ncbi:MAG: hypothetical protein FWG64_05535 [Firmicutes bacterium]|nr:hypothetical protein [Bacillota bacterium]
MQKVIPVEIETNDNGEKATFHIRKFSPFKATEILADLKDILADTLNGVFTAESGTKLEEIPEEIGDLDIDPFLPEIVTAIQRLDKKKIFWIIKELCINHQNVSTRLTDGQAKLESEQMATSITINDLENIFADDFSGIFELVYHVLRINFEDFFGNAKRRFGKEKDRRTKLAEEKAKAEEEKAKEESNSTADWK